MASTEGCLAAVGPKSVALADFQVNMEWGYIEVILGLCWDNGQERYFPSLLPPIVENHMEKKMASEMETGIIR